MEPSVPKYVVYINSEPTDKEFPHTLDGLLKALQCAAAYKTRYEMDRVYVVNPDSVDLDCPHGLSTEEINVATDYWGYGEYV